MKRLIRSDDRFDALEDAQLVPPEYSEVMYESDTIELLEVELDAVVIIDEHGNWEYEDVEYPWAKFEYSEDGNWYSAEDSIYIGSPVDIVEAVDEVIETHMPAFAGRYTVSGNIKLAYNISNLVADEQLLEDGSYDRTVYTDDVGVSFLKDKSYVSDFAFEKL